MNSAEYCVHLVGVNRLSACRKLFWVHSWHVFFLELFLEIAREKRGGKGEDAHSVKYESIQLCLSQRTNNLKTINSKASK